ncbi:MAG: hypothetical protein ACP5OA_06175 [Candidatus Woesearchaeota archaeon]
MLQNIPKEKVLAIVSQGPTFPAKVAKQLIVGGDTVLIGAILSTLVSTGEVKVSTLKIGGTPLYYIPEQESKLEEFIDHLNDKDRKTFKLLKDSKVLQDSEQDPLIRFSLRAIKDFAKPFEINLQGQKVLFWKFYLVSHDEAELLAKDIFKKTHVEQPKVEPIPELTSEPQIEQRIAHKPTVIINVDGPASVREVQELLEENTPTAQEIYSVHANEVKHESEQQHEHLTEQKHVHAMHEHHEVHRVEHHEKLAVEHHEKPKSHQSKTLKVPKERKLKTLKIEYNFFELVLNHVAAMHLDIISKEKIKKTEYDLILKNHDTNEYIYCKAKDKSNVSEGDLAPALIFAQSKKMPCLFISTGELTKKAELMMSNELKGMAFERILIKNNVVNQ